MKTARVRGISSASADKKLDKLDMLGYFFHIRFVYRRLLAHSFHGGETVSTGIRKLRLHIELLSARKNDGDLK